MANEQNKGQNTGKAGNTGDTRKGYGSRDEERDDITNESKNPVQGRKEDMTEEERRREDERRREENRSGPTGNERKGDSY